MLTRSLSEYTSNETQDLIISKRILNGERELFALLLKPHNKSVYFAIKAIAMRDDLIEKMMLASYAAALNHLYCFFGQYPFKVWLLSIAIREARRSVAENSTSHGDTTAPDTFSEEVLLAFALTEFEHFSLKEVATCLHLPVREVKRRLLTARRKSPNAQGRILDPRAFFSYDHDFLIDQFMRQFQACPAGIYSNGNAAHMNSSMRINDNGENAMQQLKEKHSENLQLCANIRSGFLKGVEMHRIKKYTDWYWSTHLMSHFASEERVIFPILGNTNPLVKRAISEHRRLRRLFESKHEIHKMLNHIEEELLAHIRFEERVLFKEVEQHAGREGIEPIERLHQGLMEEPGWPDQFWK